MSDISRPKSEQSKRSLGLAEFVNLLSPDLLKKLDSIEVTVPHPFLRMEEELDWDKPLPASVEQIPLRFPAEAKAALRKQELQKQIWQIACDAVMSDRWQCRAIRDGQLQFEAIVGPVLARARPDLKDGTLIISGELFEAVEFTCRSPELTTDVAIKFIKQFCTEHDPKSHKVGDIRAAIETELGFEMTDHIVRGLMKEANVDKAWSAGGRKVAKRKSP